MQIVEIGVRKHDTGEWRKFPAFNISINRNKEIGRHNRSDERLLGYIRQSGVNSFLPCCRIRFGTSGFQKRIQFRRYSARQSGSTNRRWNGT